jgi:hypothetical protein
MTAAHPDKGHHEHEPRDTAADYDLPLKITHAQMKAAVGTGEAVPLALSGGWLTRYRDAWWVLSETIWLRITDEATTAEIDHVAARIAEVIVVEDARVAPGCGADLPSHDEDAGK